MTAFRSTRADAPRGQLIESFHEAVQKMDPRLEPQSAPYLTAVLLYSLSVLPPQIDHLSRRLSLPREFVARCIRRLVDNGVLNEEGLIGGWVNASEGMEEAFWADVKVAQGLWLRRYDSQGSLEWAEAGAWQKAFDYTNTEPSEFSNSYIAGEGWRPELQLEFSGGWSPTDDSTWIGGAVAAVGALGEGGAGEIEFEAEAGSPPSLGAGGGSTADMMGSSAQTFWIK